MPVHAHRILFQDDHLLAVHKLSGELVVKGSGKVDKLPLFDFLRKDFPGIHPVSRLDLETSGIVVFARNRSILKKIMDTKFAGWKKTYRTIVAGVLDRSSGAIRFPLPARASAEKVPAETKFRVLAHFKDATYVEVDITTGRHHQIRRHFQMIGHPLVLDYVYGQPKFNNRFSQKHRYHHFFLHASGVTFPHPVSGKMIHIEVPLPKAFEDLLKKLGGQR